MLVSFRCAHCGNSAAKEACYVNRARTQGLRLFCDRKCAGLGRRKHKSVAQRKCEKRLYDIEYRDRNRALLKAKKAAYFQRTYDPEKAAVERKKRMPRHIEYCRRPEYRAWKQKYDRQYRAKKDFGPFAEVAMLTADLNREIKGRMSNYEIRWENKTSNKAQFRDRDSKAPQRNRSRPRQRDRRDSHSPAVS